jgi:hypothetical protein
LRSSTRQKTSPPGSANDCTIEAWASSGYIERSGKRQLIKRQPRPQRTQDEADLFSIPKSLPSQSGGFRRPTSYCLYTTYPFFRKISQSPPPTKSTSPAAIPSPWSRRPSFPPRRSSSATSPRPTTCQPWYWPSGETRLWPSPCSQPWDYYALPCCG